MKIGRYNDMIMTPHPRYESPDTIADLSPVTQQEHSIKTHPMSIGQLAASSATVWLWT